MWTAKRNRALIATALPLLILILVGASCRNNPNLTPAQNTTINLYTSLELITSANKSVAEGVVAANAQGSINDATTRAVRDWSLKVNDSARTALTVLDSTQTPVQKAQAVLDVMKRLDLPKPVADFVNSNPSASAALAVVKSIVSIQQLVSQINATPPALLGVDKGAKP